MGSEETEGPEPTDKHGIDAADKPEGGALSKDNPIDPRESREKEAIPTPEEASGGKPEPNEDLPPSAEHPHGETGS